MVDGEQDNPVFLRQVIENYKLKVNIDELNTGKEGRKEWRGEGRKVDGKNEGRIWNYVFFTVACDFCV